MKQERSELTAVAQPNGPTVFLTYQEFAHESRLSPSSVRKRVRQGELRVLRIGRSVRIPRSELDRLVELAGASVRKVVDKAADGHASDWPVAAERSAA